MTIDFIMRILDLQKVIEVPLTIDFRHLMSVKSALILMKMTENESDKLKLKITT